MEHASTSRLADLSRQVAAISNEVVALARAEGRDDLADLLTTTATRWAEPQLSIVVAGEVGAGKSSLVNALVGAPGLLPTAPEPTTGVLTSVTPATGGLLSVEVAIDDRDEPVEVSPEELGEWTQIAGERKTSVAEVRVTVPDPRSGTRLTFIDTPGVAGPHTSADSLVLAVLSRADVLLFVTGPDAPIGRPALDFLVRARQEVPAAVVAVSRIDRFRGWTTILQDSSSILERELGEWVHSTVGVSSVLSAAADDLVVADPATARELASEAGVEQLAQTLNGFADRLKFLRLAGLVRMGRRVLSAVREPGDTVVRAASATDGQLAAELDTLKAEHTALKQIGTAVLASLTDEVSALRDQLGVDMRRIVGEVTLDHEERLLNPKADPDDVLDAMERDLRAAQLRLTATIDERLTDLGERMTDRLEGASAQAEAETEATDAESVRRSAAVVKDTSMRLRVAAAIASAGGGTVMIGMTFMSAAGPANAIRSGLMGASMLLGSFVANSGVRQSRHQKLLQTVRAQARTILDEWQAATMAKARGRIVAGHRQLDAALRAAVKGRLAELESQVKERTSVLQASGEERRRRAAGVEAAATRFAQLDEQSARLEAAVLAALVPAADVVTTGPAA